MAAHPGIILKGLVSLEAKTGRELRPAGTALKEITVAIPIERCPHRLPPGLYL